MESRSIKKIAVIGAESTGKTQLCQDLALHFNTHWVPEYAREYFNNSDIYNYSFNDLEQIAIKQVEKENEQQKNASVVLFCDTALITLKIWAELEFGTCPDQILNLMKRNPYDYYLITNNDVVWEQDEQRFNKFSREVIFEMNKREATLEKVPYGIVQGLNKMRFSNAKELVLNWQKIQTL
jgi:NadR type nicotinamide-nucleotide adenylyltransferase